MPMSNTKFLYPHRKKNITALEKVQKIAKLSVQAGRRYIIRVQTRFGLFKKKK